MKNKILTSYFKNYVHVKKKEKKNIYIRRNEDSSFLIMT